MNYYDKIKNFKLMKKLILIEYPDKIFGVLK